MKTDESNLQGVLMDEQTVLDDIFHHTGLRFPHLASIDRNDREVVQKILPVVKEWVPRVPNSALRSALYMQFLTPYAAPYLNDVIEWASNVNSRVEGDLFTQILCILATPETAKRIWNQCGILDPTDALVARLFTTLSRMPSVSSEVVSRILDALRNFGERVSRGEQIRTFGMGPLEDYSRLRDDKIQQWFEQYIDSPDPDLRKLARRSNGIKSVLPAGSYVASGPPNPLKVVLSTEIDSARISDFVSELERDLGVEFPPGFESSQVLENLSESKWVVVDVLGSKRGPLEVWFRAEASNTVEVWVVTPASVRPS